MDGFETRCVTPQHEQLFRWRWKLSTLHQRWWGTCDTPRGIYPVIMKMRSRTWRIIHHAPHQFEQVLDSSVVSWVDLKTRESGGVMCSKAEVASAELLSYVSFRASFIFPLIHLRSVAVGSIRLVPSWTNTSNVVKKQYECGTLIVPNKYVDVYLWNVINRFRCLCGSNWC